MCPEKFMLVHHYTCHVCVCVCICVDFNSHKIAYLSYHWLCISALKFTRSRKCLKYWPASITFVGKLHLNVFVGQTLVKKKNARFTNVTGFLSTHMRLLISDNRQWLTTGIPVTDNGTQSHKWRSVRRDGNGETKAKQSRYFCPHWTASLLCLNLFLINMAWLEFHKMLITFCYVIEINKVDSLI